MIAGIKRTLRGLGIHEIDQVGEEMVAVIAAATISWLKKPDGVETFSNAFGIRKVEGKADKKYIIRNGMNVAREVSHDDIAWFYTLFVRGQITDPDLLEEIDKPVMFCDACGMGGHCPIEVRDRETGKAQHYCNHCLLGQEDPNLRIEGDSKKCWSCPAAACDYHPSRRQAAYA